MSAEPKEKYVTVPLHLYLHVLTRTIDIQSYSLAQLNFGSLGREGLAENISGLQPW